ncbi:MAG: hypothetical protein ACHQ50_07790 [Fimbriimonadales bacterium]
MNKLPTVILLAGIVLIAGIFTADARPEYAEKEGKKCSYCHLNPAGGGRRGFRGQFYGANATSFDKFDEAREASIAGVQPNTEAGATDPKVGYVAAVTGESAVAWRQIQLASIRSSGVLAVFFDPVSPSAKVNAKVLKRLALAYGSEISVVGVVEGDADKALKLTADLGSQIRILSDPDAKAAKKFGATQGFDMVAVSKMGDNFKLVSGFSKGNLETAIAQIGTYGVAVPQGVDLAGAPDQPVHGAKLGG